MAARSVSSKTKWPLCSAKNDTISWMRNSDSPNISASRFSRNLRSSRSTCRSRLSAPSRAMASSAQASFASRANEKSMSELRNDEFAGPRVRIS